MVSALLTVLTLGVLQLALALLVRNTLLDAAQQQSKPVAKWTWQQHLSAAISKFFKGGGK